MGWFTLIAIWLLYLSINDRFKELEKSIKKNKYNKREEKDMSKVIQCLINSKCRVTTDEAPLIVGKGSIEGVILDSDEEWIKIECSEKDPKESIVILRIDSIDSIIVLE